MSSPDTLELVNILKLHNQLGSTHGNAFLKAFALHLSRTFDADYVLIGKVEPDNQQITTLVFTHNSEFISNMTYAIEGTPCQNALHNDVCIHLDQAHELYPQDDFFIQENIVGYVGAALFDENNKQIGIVNASFKRPIHSIGPAMLTLMKSFSGRLASEMIGLLREAELQNLNKELQEAIASREAKSQVVGVLSHQIKNAMSGIIGLTELLKTENTPDKSEQYMKLLSHEENKLLALSEKILLSSKFESSSIKLLENDINVQDFIISFIEPFLIKGDSDIAISYEISKTTPQTVRSDSFWIEQILSNLLENALKYTNKGFIKIHVYAEENAEEIYHINFAVEDSGVGIPEEKLNTIFNEFEQLHQKPATEGVGLGLYICKEAAKAFKGELICDKTGKDGSRFLLSIPIEKPQAESSQLH